MNRFSTLVFAATALPCIAVSGVSDPTASLMRNGFGVVTAAHAQSQTVDPLAANDVSWLFPPPKSLDDVISMGDLTAPNPQDSKKRDPVWSDEAFHQFLAIAAGPAGRVAGTAQRIGLPAEVWSKGNWYIAGVRFDPGAPGLLDDIQKKFGQELQIRLSVQPLTRNPDGTIKVHDLAAHLVFAFNAGYETDAIPGTEGCFPRPKWDGDAYNAVVADLADLRTQLTTGQFGVPIMTSGTLGVQPGLAAEPTTARNVRQAMKALLERHLSPERLGLMTIAALSADAIQSKTNNKWIFLAMFNLKPHPHYYPSLPDDGFIPLLGTALDGLQYAQILNAAGSQAIVVPTPYPNNEPNPTTCEHAALPLPRPSVDERRGFSTADLLNGRQLNGRQPSHDEVMNTVDRIADPEKSHFFNTDCVSCHTDNEKAFDGGRLSIQGWNVRNFGWAPSTLLGFAGPNVSRPTVNVSRPTVNVSRRTVEETAAVLKFINLHLPSP
jgi:hypothetical protein